VHVSAHHTARGIAALLMTALAAPAVVSASAQDAVGASTSSVTYVACQADARNAIEHAACMSDEQDVQQQRMDRTLAALNAALDAAGRTGLAASQAAWLASTAQDAEFEATLYDATQVDNLESGEAVLVRLRTRADQLAHYLRLID